VNADVLEASGTSGNGDCDLRLMGGDVSLWDWRLLPGVLGNEDRSRGVPSMAYLTSSWTRYEMVIDELC
jgi:hypothetical protein